MTAVVGKPNAPGGTILATSRSMAEKLPVVELKPFMSKQWRPCKSIPDFYDNRSLPSTLGNGTPRKTGPGSLISDAEAEIKKLNETSRSIQGDDRRTYATRRTASLPPRPQTEGISIDGEQAFATYLDRQRYTVDEIKNGGSKIVFSCFRRAMSDLDLSKLQDIRIRGRKMEDLPPKGGNMYADPWEYYKCNKTYTIPNGSVSLSLPNPDALDNMYLRLENVECAYMDESIYDAFDRSSTLPSINVRNAPMKIKRPRTERGRRQPSGKVVQKSGYKLGVANSLDVLSHYGRPVEVEEHLSNQLKRTINQIKKTKDLRLIDSNIVSMNRYGGAYFTPRYNSSENVSDAQHSQYNPDTFIHRERSQKQQILTQRSRASPTRLNLEGLSVMSSHSIRQTEDSSAKKSQNVAKRKDDHFVSHRGNRALIASRSSLSSSVPNAAMSARALSMMRAETLPAIAPGSGVLGYKEVTSSRSRFLSNSAPEVRAHVMSSTREDPDSGKSVGVMPKICESGPKLSPVSSRSSVASDTILERGGLNQGFNGNHGDIEPVVTRSSDDVHETKEKEQNVKGGKEKCTTDDLTDDKIIPKSVTETTDEELKDDVPTSKGEIILNENSNVIDAIEDNHEEQQDNGTINNDEISSVKSKELREEAQGSAGDGTPSKLEVTKHSEVEEQVNVPNILPDEAQKNKSPEPVVPDPFAGYNEIL